MVQIAFVGCAHIHVPGFVRMLAPRSDIKVAAMWDDDPRRSKVWAERTNSRVADSAESIVNDPSISAVIVCSETSKHEKLVKLVTKAKKHVFIEKPIGMGSADAYAMAKDVEAAGVIFQTGYFQRSDAKNRFIKSLIDAGAFGRITYASGSNAHPGALEDWFKAKPDVVYEDWRWMADVKESGVGGFGDLGTHSLDILLWWLGDVSLATAQLDKVTNTYGCDETGQGLMRFKNGTIGTLHAGWVDRADPLKYTVSGTDGHAAIVDNDLFVVSKKDQRFTTRRKVEDGELPANAPHAFELFLDAVAGKTPAVPLVTVKEAAYRSAVMEALYAGASSNSWIAPK